MIRKIAMFGGAAAGAALLLGSPLLAQDGGSVWQGIYTDAQAARGQQAYVQNCAQCHGAALGGTGEAPPLAGPEFNANWNGLTVGDLFDRIRTTMPLDRPGALSRETYADVLSFVLKTNGYPAGQSELSSRSEMLATIKMEANRPAAALSAGAAAQPAAAQPAAAAPAPAAAVQVPVVSATAEQGNGAPNPYRTIENYLKLPAGRTMGSTSAVATDSRGHIWVAERCGANNCAGSNIAPIMEFDAKGNFIKAFGAGMFLFPHGFYIDREDNLWLTDGHAENGKGAQVFKMDRNGKVLLTLGKAGVQGDGVDVFSEPNAVLVAPNGDIFVSDGHTAGKGNARVLKFDRTGKFIKQWGGHGTAPGQFDVPHALAMDSKGRLFVGDRWNNRIQIFDQDGKLLAIWEQFGRPSGMYIDKKDVLYVADSESRNPQGYGYHPGWKRGIRVGSASTGQVTAFIPDTEANPDKGATSGAEGVWASPDGAIYGAQVLQKAVVRYERK